MIDGVLFFYVLLYSFFRFFYLLFLDIFLNKQH